MNTQTMKQALQKPVPVIHVFWGSLAGLYGGAGLILSSYGNTPAALVLLLASTACVIALTRKPKVNQ